MFDHNAARDTLEMLYASIARFHDEFDHQTREFIDVGEYGLALDGIAYAYTASNVSMPAHLFELFEQLAAGLNLAGDPEFVDLAEFRKKKGMAVT